MSSKYGTGGSGVAIQYDYDNNPTSEKNNYAVRPPTFNGDGTQFSWWKNKM